MLRNRLKQYRVEKRLTQAKLAKQVGVSQPNYQRWESGSVEIPDEKLRKLAFALKATPEQLLGRHPPIEAALYDPEAEADLSYYGEATIHFAGGGKPLVLSISDAAFSALHHDLQTDRSYVWAKSLCNQTVLIRAKAISDLYLASEASDTFGPEHHDDDCSYQDHHFDAQVPDNRDWEIIEELEHSHAKDYAPEDVERVQEMIRFFTSEQYKKWVADGDIKPEDLEAEKKNNSKVAAEYFSYANMTRYQLSNGKYREVSLFDNELYSALWGFTEDLDGEMNSDLIRIRYECEDQYIFLNKHAFDYIMMPTHKFEAAALDQAAEEIDAYGDDETETKGGKKPAKKSSKIAQSRP